MFHISAFQQDATLRGHYIDAQYVRRVAQSEGLARYDGRIPDHLSLTELVEKLRESPDNPIIFYRPATPTQKLCLVIQTQSMKRAMEQFGGKVVCVDTSHDTTRYPDIKLGTLLTLGAAEEGQPILLFLVEEESEASLSPVFEVLAER